MLVTDSGQAMTSLPKKGSNAVYLLEWSFADECFISSGFSVAEAFSSRAWLDVDTILLTTSYGDNQNATITGLPLTVLMWHRGKPVEESRSRLSTKTPRSTQRETVQFQVSTCDASPSDRGYRKLQVKSLDHSESALV